MNDRRFFDAQKQIDSESDQLDLLDGDNVFYHEAEDLLKNKRMMSFDNFISWISGCKFYLNDYYGDQERTNELFELLVLRQDFKKVIDEVFHYFSEEILQRIEREELVNFDYFWVNLLEK